jgi:type I protein arginine methyltransferase
MRDAPHRLTEAIINSMTDCQQELGQFIPLHYHYHMLRDRARMSGFRRAIEACIRPGAKVLELGGGTGVLSFFAAQRASRVWCVERNPELANEARRLLARNPNTERIEVIQADALEYLPPEPVDVVICEMVHVGLLREKQLAVVNAFKERYTQRFQGPLPLFIPEAVLQAIQPVQQRFDFEGYYAPTLLFQDPVIYHPDTRELGVPVIYQQLTYESPFDLLCQWSGLLSIATGGRFNALRMITKNILTILLDSHSTIDWHNQYLIVPLEKEFLVKPGDTVHVAFNYTAGDPLSSFHPLVSA